MMDPSYGCSFIHRLPTGFKLFVIFAVSIVLFVWPLLSASVATLIITVSLYVIAGFTIRKPFQLLRGIWWLLLALFIIQYFNSNWENGALVCLRLSALFLLAGLVTLTTPFIKMMDCLERIFSFTRLFGVNPAKISLALSLTLRFIPLFRQLTQEVREAQKARGLENNLLALILPVIIRSMKMQDDVAAAIEARCYDAGDLKHD